jgi:hypothetical protein
MRTLPAELMAEISKDFFCFAHLFTFEWSTTQRWTSFPQDIPYAGNWYLSKKINFDDVALSMNPKIDSVTVSIDDVNRKITKILLSEDIKDKKASIHLIPLDKNIQPLGLSTLLFPGYCDSAERAIGKKTFDIKIFNDMIKWRRLTPRRVTAPTCPWDFKHGPSKIIGSTSNTYTCILDHCGHASNYPTTGANWATYWTLAGSGGAAWIEGDWYLVGTCRYTGAETWCDRSWDRCSTLANTVNFGGFRYLPSIVGKQIFWGQSNDPTIRALVAYRSRG